MSLQNLLEMDSFSQPSSLNERDADRPIPKPKARPRAVVTKMSSSPSSRRKENERDTDDVMSFSSGGSTEKRSVPHTPSPRPRERRNTSVFENKAFIADAENANSEIANDRAFSKYKNRPPSTPSMRRSVNGNTSPDSKSRKELVTRQKVLSKGSSREDEDKHNLTYSLASEEEGDNDDARSDVTYTITEQNNPPPPQPPKQPSKTRTKKRQPGPPKLTKIPQTPEKKPPHQVHKMPDDVRDTTRLKSSKTLKQIIISPPEQRKSKGKTDYVAVDIEPGQNKTKDKEKEEQGDNPIKEKSGFINRWKQTLWKGSSTKTEKKSEAVDREVSSPTEEVSVLHEGQQKTKKKKSADTRVFMPEDGSEDENDSIKSYSSVCVEKDAKPERRKVRKKQRNESELEASESENATKYNEAEQVKSAKTETDGDDAQLKKTPPRKFQPLAKIWRSKTKAKEKVAEELSAPSSKEFAVKDESIDSITEKKKTSGRRTFKSTSTSSLKKEKETETDKKPMEEPDLGKKTTKLDLERNKAKRDNEDEVRKKRYVSETEDVVSLVSSKSDNESNEEGMEMKEEGTKSSESMRNKAKGQNKDDEPIQLIDPSSGQDLLFGITIHQSDLLPLDPNVIHPVVKVTVMYQNGRYMKRTGGKGLSGNTEGRGRKSDKKKKKDKNESTLWTENVSESVLPIMSQPCRSRHSVPTFAPTWNELLVFEESFRRFATPNENRDTEKEPIVFFEVMDFLPMNNNGGSISTPGFHGSEAGWYKVAWAFLRPIGASSIVNLNKKLRLQLYKPIKLKPNEKQSGLPEVYSWWKSQRWEKLSCTLYATPKGIIPPETRTASLRQLLSMRKEQLTQAILDSQLATKKKQSRSFRDSVNDLRDVVSWSKMEGQSCKPPNKLVATLPTSQIESLNIVISGNVHAVKFSPCGRKLAAGLDTDELHVVLIFEVPSWTLLKSLKGHHGIVYEITWKAYDFNDVISYMYLASCSADCTVRIWKMDSHDGRSMSLAKVLYHPAYVYCVKFHPTHPSMVVTGCYDGIIRVWDFKPEHTEPVQKKSKKRLKKEDVTVSPIVLLDKHTSFVNCLMYDHAGQHLFSGDGAAFIFRWSCVSPSQKKHWKLERDAKLHQGDVPVNNIDLHPSGNRILVQLRDNFIKVLDVVTFIPLQTFSGLTNERFQIGSCFSPCGNLVLSGSEDSTLCIWDADTAKILQFVSPRNHPHCIVTAVDYHPHDYYIAIGVSSAISEPSPVLVYFYEQASRMNYPMLKKSAMKMKQSLEKSRSQSSESNVNNDEMNEDREARPRPLPAKRGDSTEKFLNIIQKLDTALYIAQKRNKQRVAETESSSCAATVTTGLQHEITQETKVQRQNEKRNYERTEGEEIQENKTEVEEQQHFKFRNRLDTLTLVNERQRSASLASRKHEQFGKSREEERNIKSDSEQTAKARKELNTKTRHQSLDVEPRDNVTSSSTKPSSSKGEDNGEMVRPKPLKRRSKILN